MSVQVKGSGTIGGLDEGLVVSGIVTASTQINVGSNIKVGSAGVVTATTFSGSGASLTNLPAGNLTGTVADARISTLTASKLTGALPAISGANLTGITQTTINNNADNRVITGSGTANTLEGEANLTFDGSVLTNTGSTLIGNDIKSASDDFFVYSYKGGSNGQVRSGIQFDSTNQRMEFYTGTNERMRIETNGDLKFNSGYGSVATAYGVRAWMRYRGDTNALDGSANVSSVTDHSTGSFSMNFTTAMVDANYAVIGEVGYNDTSLNIGITHSGTHSAPTTTSMRFSVGVNYNSNLSDERYISIAIVR